MNGRGIGKHLVVGGGKFGASAAGSKDGSNEKRFEHDEFYYVNKKTGERFETFGKM